MTIRNAVAVVLSEFSTAVGVLEDRNALAHRTHDVMIVDVPSGSRHGDRSGSR